MRPANEDWAQRHAALLALPELVASAPSADERKRRLDSLGESLSAQLADLRSQLVRSGCGVLCELCTAHGAAAAGLVAAVLPQLLSNAVLLKAFATPSAAAASTVVGLAPSAAAFKVLVEKTKDKAKQVRTASFELLGLVISTPSFEVPAKALTAALGAVGRKGGGVTDPDSGVRSAAAKCFWAAHERCPGKEVDALLAGLDGKESKLVQRLKPKAPPPRGPAAAATAAGSHAPPPRTPTPADKTEVVVPVAKAEGAAKAEAAADAGGEGEAQAGGRSEMELTDMDME